MKAPFPYFGGKRRVAAEVWRRFGNPKNYVEPFAGSLAVLLARPTVGAVETVNDADGIVANFWRAAVNDPRAVTHFADGPVMEVDLHARNAWLTGRRDSLTERLRGDPGWYCAKSAGWWLWGLPVAIGDSWCNGKGPWVSEGGLLIKGEPGCGVTKGLPKLGNALTDRASALPAVLKRIARMRVTCGDWARVTKGPTLLGHGETGVFLDPPYPDGSIDYGAGDRTVSADVTEWALENGDNPLLRIAVCGYESDHMALTEAGWSVHAWKARGGYGSKGDGDGRDNAAREVIWFSPHCLTTGLQETLF